MKNLAGGRGNLHTTPNRFAKTVAPRPDTPWSYDRGAAGGPLADAICFKGKDNVCHSNFTFV